jgi:NADPH:quinone reductase-like Zn-dependent oxidoreductase
VVLDIVGGDYVQRNIDVLAEDGRLVMIGVMKDATAQINLYPILRRRLTLTGSTLRPRTVEKKSAIAAALREKVWPLIEAGRVRPVVYRTSPLVEAAAAHRVLEADEHVGKVVLTVD